MKPLEFFVPGERVRWAENLGRAGYREQLGVVHHDGGAYVAVTPEDALLAAHPSYEPMRHGAELHLPRVYLTPLPRPMAEQ